MHRVFCLLTILLAPLPAFGAGAPPVALSAGHEKMCRVRVGDELPAMTLVGPRGEPQRLATPNGEQATVVTLVGDENWMTRQLLADLPRDVAARYGERGVKTVVITVGRVPNDKQANDAYQLLGDPTGEQFAKLGSGRLPRVYVLDARGKIVWFDIEYSRSTRRELQQTLIAISESSE